jgi:hypothetical protein
MMTYFTGSQATLFSLSFICVDLCSSVAAFSSLQRVHRIASNL